MNNITSKNCVISKMNALSIYKQFITEYSTQRWNTIISIEGTYGAGKSTIKNELIALLKKNDCTDSIYVDYKALQYEEPSQITSQLYMQIGEKLGLTNKHVFSACALLKKENIEASYITGKFGAIALITGVFSLFIYSLHMVVNFSNPFISASLLFIFITLCYGRNQLIRILSGFTPRYTHIDALKNDLDKTEFNNKAFILLIDEIDRLNSNTLKLLLDEILILHEILSDREIKHKFFLFYNQDVVVSLLKSYQVPDVDFYLQKYKHDCFIVLKPDFLHTLHQKIFVCKPSENIISTNPMPPEQNIFANPQDGKPQMPSSRILNCINNHLRTFRDLDQFIAYLSTKTYSIGMSILRRTEYDDNTKDIQYVLDVLITEAFFDFRYNIKLSSLIDATNVDAKIYNAYKEFVIELDHMYRIHVPGLPPTNVIKTNSRSGILTAVCKLEELYYRNTKIYPSTITDNNVSFNIDDANNLENIFTYSSKKQIINYISLNLGEFLISPQSQYPYLDNLASNFNNLTNNDLLNFFIDLEIELSKKIQNEFTNFVYTFNYSKELYEAAINSIIYCFCKLIPQNYDESDEIINQFVLILNQSKQNFPIFYLALNKILLPSYVYKDHTKKQIAKLIKILECNIFDEPTNFVFLFDCLNIFCEKHNFKINNDLTLDKEGNCLSNEKVLLPDYTAGGVVDKLNVLIAQQTEVNVLFYMIGATISCKQSDTKLKPDCLLLGGVKDLLKNILADMFTKLNNPHAKNELYSTVYETWKIYTK